MSSIAQRLYNEVMMADNFTCVYCGLRTPDVTIDHFVPSSQSGPDNLHNLFCACPTCNYRKGDRMAHQVGMVPRFGRFLRPATRRVAAARVTPLIPTVEDPERAAQIVVMAKEVKEDGAYRYSANQILRIIGGSASAVKSLIATQRK